MTVSVPFKAKKTLMASLQREEKHMKRTLWIVLGVVFVSTLSCCMAWAQATAQISGTVKDQSGAVLPGVEVTATQTETGIARDAVTNETGSYVLPNLPIGPYRLEAALPGFRTYVQTGIVLQVNSSPVINPVLEVGQVSEQVEVQANAALVETRSAGVGQVVENARILELPLNGRQVIELIALAGAATPAPIVDGSGRDPFGKGECFRRGRIEHGIELHARRRESQQSVTTTATCRCRFPMRCRSSRSRPAPRARRTA